jgi:hypothetical protein
MLILAGTSTLFSPKSTYVIQVYCYVNEPLENVDVQFDLVHLILLNAVKPLCPDSESNAHILCSRFESLEV